jgi:hypothetical protein
VASRTYGCIAAVLGAVALAVFAAGCGSSSNNAAAAAATTGTTTTTQTATTGGGGPNSAGFQAYRDCLTAHGVTPPARPGGGPPTGGGQPSANGTRPTGGGPQGRFGNLTPKQQAAMTACQSKRPAGGFGGGRGGNANGGPQNPAFAKYTACLKSHGVTFGSTSSSSPAFIKATAACKSLLPSATGGSVNGGTTSP